ncbi:MAG: SCO family protein [Reichenbachiella sp.]|uniref:SCO family protein n=1 Tax=Reichenbachiella sp. TaxID=2184521 RepID=UPI003267B9FA
MNRLILLVVIGLCSCQAQNEKSSRVERLPFYNDPSFTPVWVDNLNELSNDFHSIPDFELIDQDGDTITTEQTKDKIYVADFFFTSCPGICPKMTKNMGMLQKAFMDDNEVILLSHSVTPDLDSVSVLQSYANRHGVVSKKWHLLTGERELIYDLGRNFYFVEENLGIEKSADDFLHTENFILVDSQKHIRGIYNGLNKTDIMQLIADIKTLKKESTTQSSS